MVQGWKTWRTLERERPVAVLVQAPPVVAPLVVAVWCWRRCVPFAIDAHSGSFYYGRWRMLLPLQRWLSRRAAVTVVAHETVLKIVQSWGARGLFLEDKIPQIKPAASTLGSEGRQRVAIISSFDYDEPTAEVFAAARRLPQVTFYHTGNPAKAPTALLAQKPENVILTGFVSQHRKLRP